MKKTIAILLVLVLVSVGLFAADEATVKITTKVAEFMHIGLTDKDTDSLVANAFTTEANFLAAVKTSIIYDESDFGSLATFETSTLIAYVWGITNTLTNDLTVTISTDGFIGEDDTGSIIPLKLNGDDDETTLTISKAEGNDLGKLDDSNTLSIMEKTAGLIAMAPAQDYEATITIEITT